MAEDRKEAVEGQVFEPQTMAMQGIRVVDLTVVGAGPVATKLLGQLGAEIIKIEQPGQGDILRSWATMNKIPGVPQEMMSALWEDVNQNKMSVTIDLHKEKGQGLLHRLAAKSDVFTTNLLPEALKRFRVDYDSLKENNPKLIYARGSVFGPNGPDANRPGYQWHGAARSGLMTEHNEFGATGRPLDLASGATDTLHALVMAYGVLAALVTRERLGIGQEVLVSQLAATMNLLLSHYVAQELWASKHMPQIREPREFATNPLNNWYQCLDGRWIMLTMSLEDLPDWHRLCLALGKPELKDDPRFKDWRSCSENSKELIRILDKIFATRRRDEWDIILRQAGVVWFCVINELSDLANDPQVLANNYIWEIDHPQYGRVKYPGHPCSFSKTPATFRTPAPELGQHTEVVLMDILGCSWDEVQELRKENII